MANLSDLISSPAPMAPALGQQAPMPATPSGGLDEFGSAKLAVDQLISKSPGLQELDYDSAVSALARRGYTPAVTLANKRVNDSMLLSALAKWRTGVHNTLSSTGWGEGDDSTAIGRVARGVVEGALVNAPSMALAIGGTAVGSRFGIPKRITMLPALATQYAQTYEATGGDKLAALGSAASLATGVGGAGLGAQMAGNAAKSAGVGAVGQALARAGGSTLGGIAGVTPVALATDEQLRQNITTPEGAAMFFGGQLAFGALDLAQLRGTVKAVRLEGVRQGIADAWAKSEFARNEVKAKLDATPINDPARPKLQAMWDEHLANVAKQQEAVTKLLGDQKVEPTGEGINSAIDQVSKGERPYLYVPKSELGLSTSTKMNFNLFESQDGYVLTAKDSGLKPNSVLEKLGLPSQEFDTHQQATKDSQKYDIASRNIDANPSLSPEAKELAHQMNRAEFAKVAVTDELPIADQNIRDVLGSAQGAMHLRSFSELLDYRFHGRQKGTIRKLAEAMERAKPEELPARVNEAAQYLKTNFTLANVYDSPRFWQALKGATPEVAKLAAGSAVNVSPHSAFIGTEQGVARIMKFIDPAGYQDANAVLGVLRNSGLLDKKLGIFLRPNDTHTGITYREGGYASGADDHIALNRYHLTDSPNANVRSSLMMLTTLYHEISHTLDTGRDMAAMAGMHSEPGAMPLAKISEGLGFGIDDVTGVQGLNRREYWAKRQARGQAQTEPVADMGAAMLMSVGFNPEHMAYLAEANPIAYSMAKQRLKLLQKSMQYLVDGGSKTKELFARGINLFDQAQNQVHSAAKLLTESGLNVPDVIVNRAKNLLSRERMVDSALAVDAQRVPTEMQLPTAVTESVAKARKSLWKGFDDYLFTPLSRTYLNPLLRNAYTALNELGVIRKNQNLNAISTFGQNELGTLPHEQALANAERMLDKFSRDPAFRKPITDAFSEAQTQAHNNRKEGFTIDELKSRFKMTDEQAQFTKRTIDMVKASRDAHLETLRDVALMKTSELVMHLDRTLNPDNVLATFRNLQPISRQAGALTAEIADIRSFVEQAQASGQQLPPNIMAEAQQRSAAAEQARNQLLAQQAAEVQKLVGHLPKPDELAAKIAQTLTKNEAAATRFEKTTNLTDYLPTTRKKQYVVRSQERDANGVAKTVEATDFNTKAEADAHALKQQQAGLETKIFDQAEQADRAQLQMGVPLEQYRNEALSSLERALSDMQEYSASVKKNPAEFDEFAKSLRDHFTPLADEIQASYQRGQTANMQRRNYVKGFDVNDYMSNALEYTFGMHSLSERARVRAYTDLQWQQAGIHNKPDGSVDYKMLSRLSNERVYTMGNTTEWSPFRRIAYTMYLGGSIRQLLLNVTQPFTSGVAALQAVHGMKYFESLAQTQRGINMYAKQVRTGSTGNQMLDVLYAQAKKDPGFFPAMTDALLPEVDRIASLVDVAKARASRFGAVGEKLSQTKRDFAKGFEQTMRLPMVVGEEFNRGSMFLATADWLIKQGETNLQTIYNKAKNLSVDVNYIGTKANRPGIYQTVKPEGFGHGVVTSAMAMRTFQLGALSQMAAYYKAGLGGNKAALRGANTALLHFVAASGMLGIPLAGLANEVFGTVLNRKPTDYMREFASSLSEFFGADAEVGGKISDAMTMGLPTLLGFDLSRAIGLGDMAPVRVTTDRAGRAQLALEGLLGPSYSSISTSLGAGTQAWRDWQALGNATDAASLIRLGENMLRSGGPQFLKQAVRFMDTARTGEYLDKTGSPVTRNLGIGGQLAATAGFTPVEATRFYNERSMIAEQKQSKIDDRGAMSVAAARHLIDGRDDLAIKAIEAWQQRNPNSDASSLQQSVSQAYAKALRGEEPLPAFSDLEDYQRIQRAYGDRKSKISMPLDRYLEQLQVGARIAAATGKLPNTSGIAQAAQLEAFTRALMEKGYDAATAQVMAKQMLNKKQ